MKSWQVRGSGAARAFFEVFDEDAAGPALCAGDADEGMRKEREGAAWDNEDGVFRAVGEWADAGGDGTAAAAVTLTGK